MLCWSTELYSFRHSIKNCQQVKNMYYSVRSLFLDTVNNQQENLVQSFPYLNLKIKCFAARFSFVLLASFSFPPSLAARCCFEPECLFWFYCAYKNLRSIFLIFEKHQNIEINIRTRFSTNLGMLSGEAKKYFLPWSQRTGRLWWTLISCTCVKYDTNFWCRTVVLNNWAVR